MKNPLTIAMSNRDRLDPSSKSTQLLFLSLKNQTLNNFQVVIADGGSKNIEEVKHFVKTMPFEVKVVNHPIGELFERSLLNNVAIRNSETEYVMCTDADMFFGKDFIKTVSSSMRTNVFIESRTLYVYPKCMEMIYQEKIDPFKSLDISNCGRLKKRTTAGGCQLTHILSWNKLRGYNEAMKQWGSEDTELLTRAEKMGMEIKWLGENNDIQLFHQPHPKPNLEKDLQHQEKNKKWLENIRHYASNPEGWGGIKD